MITTLAQKQKKFLRKTLSQPKGSGFFSSKFCSLFLTRKLGKFGNFFGLSNVNLTSFAIFWGNFHQIFNITKLEEKKNPAQEPSLGLFLVTPTFAVCTLE
jgi:succinate-acetate transporter protein